MIPMEKILSYNLKQIGHQLIIKNAKKETEKDDICSDNGPFNNLPREIIFKIFSYLNLYSLGKKDLTYYTSGILERANGGGPWFVI